MKRQKFAKCITVETNKMTYNKALKLAHKDINEMSSAVNTYTEPKVNYKKSHKTYVIAYVTYIEWKLWYAAWLSAGNFFINGFYMVRRWFGWQN